MGMSNRHWNPPLKLEDFEFENDRLVYIRGMRPRYLDGYALIAATEACALILRDIVKLKDLTPVDDFDKPTIGQANVDRMKALSEGRSEANEDFRLPPYDFDSRNSPADERRIYGIAGPDADPSGTSVPESSTDKDSDGW